MGEPAEEASAPASGPGPQDKPPGQAPQSADESHDTPDLQLPDLEQAEGGVDKSEAHEDAALDTQQSMSITESSNDTITVREELKMEDGDRDAIAEECGVICAGEIMGFGNDSGVEVAAGEYASSGAPDQLSCASSLISCGSACDDSFDMLSCKHDRLDDFKAGAGAAGDGTSEGGSESSSVTGGGSGGAPRRTSAVGSKDYKRRVAVNEPGRAAPRPRPSPAPRGPNLATRERARSRDKSAGGEKPPPPGPKPNVIPRSRLRNAPDVLALICRESPSLKVKATKTSTARCRTPGTPPDEPRSLRLITPVASTPAPLTRARAAAECKAAFDKYATLPRRKRETSPGDAGSCSSSKRDSARSTSVSRELPAARGCSTLRRTNARDSPPLRSLPPYPKHKSMAKTRIYHETSAQTALSGSDVQNALKGIGIKEVRTDLVVVQKSNKSVQADYRNVEVERLEQRIKSLQEANRSLQSRCDTQEEQLELAEKRAEVERAEKAAAQQELQHNTQRVLQLLGGEAGGADGLALLEEQLTRQHDEIGRLHTACRELQKDAEASARAQRSLEAQALAQEAEAAELLDFLAAEKGALQEALREAELAARELLPRRAECRALLRLAETRRQQLLALRARRARPCACAPLPSLAAPLSSLLTALVLRHRISPEDLEDVIFHNEAFSRSASSEAYSPGSPPPRAPPPAPARHSDEENSADLLDSETEPCLMMESVLEDVAIPDTYSHNLVSCVSVASCPAKPQRLPHLLSKDDSCSSLQNITGTFSCDDYSPVIPDDKLAVDMACYYQGMESVDFCLENDLSLQNLSQAILNRQQSEAECSISNAAPESIDASGHNGDCNGDVDGRDGCLIEQVIEVDNLVHKLLKVLKIIQAEGEETDGMQHLTTVKESPQEAIEDDILLNGAVNKMAELSINKQQMQDSSPQSCSEGESDCRVSSGGEWCGRQSCQPRGAPAINSAA